MKLFGLITASLTLALSALSFHSTVHAQPVTVRVDTPEFGIRIGDRGYRHHPGSVVVAPPVVVAPAPVYIPPRVIYAPPSYGYHHYYWQAHKKHHHPHFEHRGRYRTHWHRNEQSDYQREGKHKERRHRGGRHIDHVQIHPHR